MRDVLLGLLPVAGVVVGSILTHLLARSKDRNSQRATLHQQAYADYLRAVSSIAMDRTPAAISQLIDAKSRMAIYASDRTLDRLADFEKTELRMSDPDAAKAFVQLAVQMRSENGATLSNQNTLQIILFGTAASASTNYRSHGGGAQPN